MEETAFVWSYQENVDELNEKLLYTTLELEQLKIESTEETRRTNEYVKQLLQLVEFACKERDEARDQLQNLLNKVMSSTNIFAKLPDSPLPDSLSSPGDSLIDAVSSPDLSNTNVGDSSNIACANQPFVIGCEGIMDNNMISNAISSKVDQGSLVIDNIVKGKPLPQKGKLLKAVVDAGPILQNLLVAGPLPRWRNPPQLETSQIPLVPIKGCDHVNVITNAKIAPNFAEMSCFSQMLLSTSVLSFGNGAYGCCLGSDNSYDVQVSKRQRFH